MQVPEFCTQEEFDFIMRDKNRAVLNDVLRKVFQAGVETALLMTPEIADRNAKNAAMLSKKLSEFIAENKEFIQHKDLVLRELQLVEAENPGKNVDELLVLGKERIQEKIKFLAQHIPQTHAQDSMFGGK